MSIRHLSGLDAAIHLKSELLQVLSRSAPSEWPRHLTRFTNALAATKLQDPTALVVLLADLQIEISLLEGRSEPYTSTVRGLTERVPTAAGTATLARAASDFIDEHYAESLTLGRLASALTRSKRHLAARFRKETGRTVHTYLTHVRMWHALALILQGEKIEAVSLLVGYRSKKNFYRHFKQVVGVTPLEYRKKVTSGRSPV